MMELFGLTSISSSIYILLAVVFSIALLIVFVMCVCHGEKDSKMQDYGIPGRLSSIVVESPRQTDHGTPIVTSDNGPELKGGSEETEENGDLKYRTVVERALPDIPNGLPSSVDTDTDQTPDSGSECYATVTNKLPILDLSNGKATKLNHVELRVKTSDDIPNSVTDSETLPQGVEGSASTSTSGSSSAKTVSTHTYSHVQKPHHPYARLSNQIDSDPGTDEYDESLSSDRDKRTNYTFAGVPRTISKPNLETDMSSPSSSSIGPSSDDSKPISSIAGQAVAGNIPSAEIPYMTPPLDEQQSSNHSLPPHFVENVVAQREVPYTVISVREPLERVRMQTQKLRKRQQSNQGSSTDEPEGYYMEVPDDEQTYAEIESGPNSGESSTTYDHIEPRNPDFPPDPPTVESLKSVAQAHSRQASIASMSSFGSGGDGQASSTKDVKSLYSVVDKNSKKGNSASADVSNVDELYAKVQKKRAGGTMSVSGIEDVLRTDAVGSDDVFGSAKMEESPPELPPVSGRLNAFSLFEPSVPRTLARRHSAEPGYSMNGVGDEPEPGYASVNLGDCKNAVNQKPNTDSDDPGYERIRRETETEEAGYEFILNNKEGSDPGYESVANLNLRSGRFVTRKDSDLGSADPGYERVMKLTKVDYELSSDPEYECVKFSNRTDSDADPGYEGVPLRVNLSRKDSEVADPGYETVKRVISRKDSEVADPGYEKVKRVRQKASSSNDPGYEKVSKKRLDSEEVDPGYEKINKIHKNRNSEGDVKKDATFFTRTNFENNGGDQIHEIKIDPVLDSLETDSLDELEETRIDSPRESGSNSRFHYESAQYTSEALDDNGSQSISSFVTQTSSESGIIVSGERISIRINCTNLVPTSPMPKNEPLEVLSVFNNATNVMLGGAPSIHSFTAENKVSENGIDDGSIDCQSNQDYETASSGGSTLSSRYSTSNRRSEANSISLFTSDREDVNINSDQISNNGSVEFIEGTRSNLDGANKKRNI